MLEVLYEDNHIIAINKKSGDIVQGDKTGDITLGDKVEQYLIKKYNKPGKAFVGVIHRLDRPVTGVVLFAKTSKGLSKMNQLFQQNKIQKTYWALSENSPEEPEGKLIHYLVKNPKNNKTTAFKTEKANSKKAELRYKVLKEGSQSLIEVYPKTGRPHQIRVQISSLGCPIIGDIKYGASKPNPDQSICLHARFLDFIHPIKNVPIHIEAPLPKNNPFKEI
jgi:23S rRNA pseudouridine1911/1915/1917 synthase